MKNFGFCFLFLFVSANVIPQSGSVFNRVEASFSIKTKLPDGKGSLEMGRMYFDKTNKTLVYDFSFPEKSTLVIIDTSMYAIKDKKLVNQLGMHGVLESTVFNVILSGELDSYGLNRSRIFRAVKVEKQSGLIITTYRYIGKNNLWGDVIISTRNADLHGVVTKNPNGAIISKQFFSKYVVVRGLKIPTEITQIIYKETGKVIQVTTFRDIIVNNQNNEAFYNYRIPFN